MGLNEFLNKEYFPAMHSAEHILNQTMVRKFKINRSFSNHIERKKSKCDYYFERNLTNDEISDIEGQVNFIISQNMEVKEKFISKMEAEKNYNLDKLPDPTVETIRIIDIGDYDSCPCSGNHVSNTSEIGIFKIISTDFSNNILRIRYKLLPKKYDI
jgi:Ser-tRNA(Ala) deacylase AlaX